jgi:hypothetical protein
MITGWRYLWRKYLGWLPIQFCMVCGGWYWGGFPRFNFTAPRVQWMPWWQDYCSKECHDIDVEFWGR